MSTTDTRHTPVMIDSQPKVHHRRSAARGERRRSLPNRTATTPWTMAVARRTRETVSRQAKTVRDRRESTPLRIVRTIMLVTRPSKGDVRPPPRRARRRAARTIQPRSVDTPSRASWRGRVSGRPDSSRRREIYTAGMVHTPLKSATHPARRRSGSCSGLLTLLLCGYTRGIGCATVSDRIFSDAELSPIRHALSTAGCTRG